LKITTKARNLVNAEVEAIDSLRIEPLSYSLAFRIARTAVGGVPGDQQQDLVNTNKAIAHPEHVESLNLEVISEQELGGEPCRNFLLMCLFIISRVLPW
jgi:hypothetical protein